MNKKTIIIAVFGILVFLAFMAMGFFIMTNTPNPSNDETKASTPQVNGERMMESENEARQYCNRCLMGLQNGSLSKIEFANKIESSLLSLQENLGVLDVDNEEKYLYLLYNSSYLMSFTDGHSSTLTDTERLIEKHRITKLASSVHDYVVNAKQDDAVAEQFISEIKSIQASDIDHFTKLIEEKAKE